MAQIDEEHNKKIQSLGIWIDKTFLEDILSNKLNREVSVENYSITAAVADGENYMSTLFKTSVTYTVEGSSDHFERKIMIKGLPESAVSIERVSQNNFFGKECYTYSNILPKMRRLITEYFPPDTLTIAPEEYFTSRPNTLVMEDLSQDEYKMKLRQQQMDYEHSISTLRALARFHALSLKLYEEDPEIISGACSSLYTDDTRSYASIFLEEGLKALINEMENWSEYEDASAFAKKLQKVTPFLWEKVQVLEQPMNRFRVINHGDLWMNNVMFKYNNDGDELIHSVKFVDFQLARFTSPAMDIHYFINSSVQTHVLRNHLFELISQYHDALSSDLATLDLSTDYSLSQLHEDMRDYAAYGITAISSITAMVLAPVGGVAHEHGGDFLAQGDDNEHLMVPIFRTELYKNHAIEVFRLYNLVGYLDDASARLQYVADEMMEKENEDDSDEEFQNKAPTERVMSAHDRHILTRLKSSVKGYFRKFMDI